MITKEFNENVLFTCTIDIRDNINENTKILGTLYTDQTKELDKLAEMMKAVGLDPNSYATNRGVYCGYVLLSLRNIHSLVRVWTKSILFLLRMMKE